MENVIEQMLVDEFKASMTATEDAEATGRPKEIFCNNWPMAKEALEALGTFAPGSAKLVINVIIKIGDAAHRAICN